MSETGRGLQGHLELVCALDSRGLSSLQRQSFRAPFHISKPHFDAETLVVNVASPTAGYFDGDRVESQVRVESGARLLLTTPAANRAHRMRGGFARAEQRFEVASGAWLEFWPELFIPQAGTRFAQRTELRIEPGGEVLFVESLAPGRVASGEAFAYERLEWETDLWVGERLAARERYSLFPESEAVRALQARFATAYYASCFLVTERVAESAECWAALHGLQSEEMWIGQSRLCCGGYVIKVLASGPVALRAALARIRGTIYEAMGWRAPALRRVAGIG